jgi:hypothetical protein
MYLCRFWTKAPAARAAAVVFVAVAFGAAGCGTDKAAALEVASAVASTYNEGTEDSQYAMFVIVCADMAGAKRWRPAVRIAGEKIDGSAMEVTYNQDERSIAIRVLTDKSRDATFSIECGDRRIEGILPSGVALSETAREPGSVSVSVTHGFNIRCIAWIRLLNHGETVGGSLLRGADEKDGAVALHGHRFLTDDEYALAALLAETLASHFGNDYEFSVDGKTVTAASRHDSGADLAIEVYQYTTIVEAVAVD